MNNTYEPVIGLEIHVELATKSKMFCGCKNDPFFASDPNIYTCPVCLGMPGGLPVPNKKAIEWCIMLGLSLGCTVAKESKFDRKNYFYPDLPKGYQITQYDQPLCINGKLKVRGDETREIRIRRVHLEEDTGKLQHVTVDGKKATLIDFNRSGVPLVEIVTEPDFRTVDEVDLFLKKLQRIIRYLDISDAEMEKGSMRLEPSISLSFDGKLPDYRVELKNINSFRFVQRALEAEMQRQQDPAEGVQATRRFDEKTGKTVLMRSKEQAEDYRYFPEPDIPPMQFEKKYIDTLRNQLPELLDAKRERFKKDFNLNEYDANFLTETRVLADYFEECMKAAGEISKDLSPKMIANWLINKQVDMGKTLPAQLVEEIRLAREVVGTSEEEVVRAIDAVLTREEKAVGDYRKGKEQAIMYLFGMVNKELKGKGEKSEILTLLKEKLQSSST